MAAHPYRDAEPRETPESGPFRRVLYRLACALLGHRWHVVRIARNMNPNLAAWFLHGCDADCERCGAMHRDADRREALQ